MAEQLEFFEIPSPCVRVCTTDERGICRGCFRNRQERFEWLTMTNEQKREVLRLSRQRYVRFLRAKKQAQTATDKNDQLDLFSSQPTLFDFDDEV